MSGNTQKTLIMWENITGKGGKGGHSVGICPLGTFLVDFCYINEKLVYKLIFTANFETIKSGILFEELDPCQSHSFVIANSENHVYPIEWAGEIAEHIALGWLIGKMKLAHIGYE